jgi:molybdopterin converting factor small subunit
MLAFEASERNRQMKVTVQLQTYLEQYAPDGQSLFEYTLPEGATVQTLVRQLNLPEELAGVIVLNERIADFPDPLHEGDRVTLIPPLAGG